jgi:hypothetical protein
LAERVTKNTTDDPDRNSAGQSLSDLLGRVGDQSHAPPTPTTSPSSKAGLSAASSPTPAIDISREIAPLAASTGNHRSSHHGRLRVVALNESNVEEANDPSLVLSGPLVDCGGVVHFRQLPELAFTSSRTSSSSASRPSNIPLSNLSPWRAATVIEKDQPPGRFDADRAQSQLKA